MSLKDMTNEELAARSWMWAHRSPSGELWGVTVDYKDAAKWCREGKGAVIALQDTPEVGI